MSTLKTPFRYDFVGSFLRPQKLKDAKADFAAGKITQDELEKITDDCVRDIVAKQKAAGFHAITDGEFRRKFWHLDFMWGFEGVAHEKKGGGVQFNGEMADLEATYLVGTNTTGLVMAFVVVIAIFLFLCDKLIEWGLYDGLLRLSL